MNAEIKYIPCFVAFLDILGYSDLVKESDYEKSINTIKRMSSAIKSAKDTIKSGWPWEKDKFVVRVFSDCICLSIPEKMDNFDAFFQILALVQANLLRERICIRGGVARGKFYSDDNIIFSSGLVEAYETEETIAEFPRIVVPKCFWSYVAENGQDENIIWFKDAYIWKDYHDDQLFIDYLNFMPYDRKDNPDHDGKDLKNHKYLIEKCLDIYIDRDDLYRKYEWMANYHNSWCKEEYPEHPELLIMRDMNYRHLGPFA